MTEISPPQHYGVTQGDSDMKRSQSPEFVNVLKKVSSGLTVKELAVLTGLSTTTVYSLVKMHEIEGIIRSADQNRKYDDDFVNQIADMRRAGMLFKQIGAELGITAACANGLLLWHHRSEFKKKKGHQNG